MNIVELQVCQMKLSTSLQAALDLHVFLGYQCFLDYPVKENILVIAAAMFESTKIKVGTQSACK